MKKLTLSMLSILTLVLLVMPIIGFAQQPSFSQISTIQQLIDKINQIANYFLWIIVTISVVVILYAGYLFLTAGGNAETLGSAKNTLIYGLIGVGVAILAKALVLIVTNLIG